MLICRQSERALVDLGDFPQSSFEVAARLVLDAPIFDKKHKVVSAVFSDSPAEIVDVPVECERSSGSECVTKPLFDFVLVHIQAHPIDGVF
jgi:hypothetical protein